jgi:hypothetical protein
MYFSTFQGFTFRYWGDFEFFVFLTIVNYLFLKLNLISYTKFFIVSYAIRQIIRNLNPTKIEDVSPEKRPKDVVIIFKRCKKCSNLFDKFQIIAFVMSSYLLVKFKKEISDLF